MEEKKIEWLLKYADGSEFSNLDGEPWEAPRWGVQFVYYLDDVVGVATEQSPIGFWGWLGDRWVGFWDHMGFWDYLGNHKRSPVIPLFGRTLPDEEWERRTQEEAEWKMGVDKSAWRPRERRKV